MFGRIQDLLTRCIENHGMVHRLVVLVSPFYSCKVHSIGSLSCEYPGAERSAAQVNRLHSVPPHIALKPYPSLTQGRGANGSTQYHNLRNGHPTHSIQPICYGSTYAFPVPTSSEDAAAPNQQFLC
ncbi:unnamed protein product [Chondrus crispus]|uniref:Uncharacterized protein n=1 Tax=Chondrus crispus TaxID=2769 RepID=R7Q833_CHOCR|nr:unnamed protein product [Chondrus crispus]CDF33640.1 unnamed protein product [Chondrus crispus]|eukprot:XP_005713459.1 unnamed protein product [Chondrus crispus]